MKIHDKFMTNSKPQKKLAAKIVAFSQFNPNFD